MRREECPNCKEPLSPPGGAHGLMGHPMHSNLDCPKCGEPLIWFTEGHFADEGWRIDDGEKRRRAHIAKYED